MYIVQLYTAFLIMWGTLVSLKVVSNSINLWRFQWSQWVCFPFGKTRFTLNLFSHSMCYSVVTAVSVETSFVIRARPSLWGLLAANLGQAAELAILEKAQGQIAFSRRLLKPDGCKLKAVRKKAACGWAVLVRTPWTSWTGGPTTAATWGSPSTLAGLDPTGGGSAGTTHVFSSK